VKEQEKAAAQGCLMNIGPVFWKEKRVEWEEKEQE
jgi:hypothetical protein